MALTKTQREILLLLDEGHPLGANGGPNWKGRDPQFYVGRPGDVLLPVRVPTFNFLYVANYIKPTNVVNDVGHKLWTISEEGQEALNK